MGKGFKHGAGGIKEEINPLNFTVTAYPSEVELNTATPEGSVIGVVTTNPINGWHLTAEQPENMAEGAVWFCVSSSSNAAINALKENTIMVYPVSAKQMVSGALVELTAKIWQNEAWVELWDQEYLYNSGDQCTNITGGWTISGAGASTTALASDSITLGYNSASGSESIIYTNKKLTFPYSIAKKLKVLVDVTTYVDKTNAPCSFGLSESPKRSSAPKSIGYAMYTTFSATGTGLEFELDISNATGSYYVVFGDVCKGKIHKIWLE